jgi:hypothetical protein
MFNERIVGLCKSLTVTVANFLKVGNGERLTELKPLLTVSMYHKYHLTGSANVIWKSLDKSRL